MNAISLAGAMTSGHRPGTVVNGGVRMYNRLNDEHYYRKFYFQDSFHAQCVDVNSLSMIQFDRAAAQVHTVLKHEAVRKAKRVIATGCGDSNLVAFVLKEAFARYLPDVEYIAVEAIELSRHFEFPEDCSDTVALFISVSGGIFRTIEAMRQCKRHGVTTIGVTANTGSPTAQEADILYFHNCPPGDNNAGLRTIYINIITVMILAAAMAEQRTGEPKVAQLREQVQKYHDEFFAQFDNIDDMCFETAIHWMDTKKTLEIMGDGPMFWAGKIVQAKVVELSGDPCTVIDSENYMHVNSLMGPGEEIGEIVLVNSHDDNVSNIARAVNAAAGRDGREVLLLSDAAPEALGITAPVRWCYVPMPEKEWTFLAQLYAFLPGALFGGFRHTTIGEPMFRGGMDTSIFVPTYFSPIDVVEN